MSSFNISVVIPVYNSESTIRATMESVLAQGILEQAIQVVLVDDGSADQSGAICDEYAEKYPKNVQVIHKENGGVSAARNAGMDAASGRYIMFLDADDLISEGSISEIVTFFDAHYEETDLVTYTLIYRYVNGKTWKHWRYREYLTKSAVYDLTTPEAAQIAQVTMNICVKGDTKQRFDENRKIWEDQSFITQTLAEKKTLGYVRKAQYIYVRDGSSTISQFHYPIFCYDLMMDFYDEMLQLKKEQPSFSEYVDSIILYNIAWRIKSDVLLPYHLKGEAYEEAFRHFVKIIDGMENRHIMQYKHMDSPHKYWLFSLKTINRPVPKIHADGVVDLVDKNGLLEKDLPVEIVITKLVLEENSLHLLAYLRCNVLDVMDTVRLFVKTSVGEDELSLSESQYSYYATAMKTNTYYVFSKSFSYPECEEISFYAELNGVRFSADIKAVARSGMDSSIGRNYMNCYGHAVWIDEKKLHVGKRRHAFVVRRLTKEVRLAKRYPRQFPKRQVLRLFPKRGGVWLYTDSNDSVDNGFWQFLHDIEMQDGIERYYVCTKKALSLMPEGCAEKYKEHFVPFDSMEHKKLLLRADYIFAAFVSVRSISPFGGGYVNAYRDMFHFKVIYLQYGVMHAKIPNMYSNEKIPFVDGVVCSTQFEYENLRALQYRDSDIFKTGMSRFDLMKKKELPQTGQRILFAPSWRSNLVQTSNRVQKPVARF